MSNVLIAYRNRTDAGALSGGSWRASLPLTNLQTRKISRVARSTDLLLISTQFTIDIGADRLVRVIGLIGHNLSLSAKYRIRLSNVADFSVPLVDSGWVDVWPVVYSASDLEWQAPNWWSGRYLKEEIEGFNWTLPYTLSASIIARYIDVQLDDATDNTDGYVQVGRLFIGDGWQPVVNMSYGAGIGWETKTVVDEAISGAEYFQRRSPYRVARFSINTMRVNEAFGRAFEIQRRAGVDGEVLFLWDPEDSLHSIRRQYLGRIRTLSPIDQPYLDTHSTAFEIKELL